MEDIRKQLQCRSCQGPMFPPILICEKGESVCQDCRKKHKKCPLCDGNFTDNPSETLEVLAKLPCFECNKCKAPLKLIELKQHYAKCLKNETCDVRCPIGKCKWKGGISDIEDHWRSKKLALHAFVEDNICHTKLTKYSYFSNMVEAHGSIFFFKSMCSEGKFYWAVQYVGSPNQIENYSYEIEIFNPHKLECKFILGSYCQSIEMENNELFKEGVCIFTPKEMLEPYLTADGVLLYNLRLRKVDRAETEKNRKKVNKLLEKYTKK